jgi:hypothetical protein
MKVLEIGAGTGTTGFRTPSSAQLADAKTDSGEFAQRRAVLPRPWPEDWPCIDPLDSLRPKR